MNIPQPDKAETIEVRLTKHAFPQAYAAKMKELTDPQYGCGMTQEEAETFLRENTIVLEILYQTGFGLFAVESEALDSGSLVSPYNGEELKEPKKPIGFNFGCFRRINGKNIIYPISDKELKKAENGLARVAVGYPFRKVSVNWFCESARVISESEAKNHAPHCGCGDLVIPDSEWDAIGQSKPVPFKDIPDIDDGSRHEWYCYTGRGCDSKYGRVMWDRKSGVTRTLTLQEFYGNAPVD